MKPWLVRSLVVLTALLCLGMAGYAGQVWWAKRVAPRIAEDYFSGEGRWGADEADFLSYWDEHQAQQLLKDWRQTPWYGNRVTLELRYCYIDYPVVWVTPRGYEEVAKAATGQDLGNDPDAWQAWFRAHPNLVWDDKQKRLGAGKPEVKP